MKRNSIENREHYSLILLNDHYGREYLLKMPLQKELISLKSLKKL